MIAAYLRVSTDKQDIANQRYLIEGYAEQKNLTIDKWVEESVSGRSRFRNRQIWELIEDLKKGDSLIVSKISRIGRNMFDLNGFFGDCIYRGIKVIAIRDNFILEDTLSCRIMANSMALVADAEVENIRQNTKMALARKKAEGQTLGRPVGSRNRRRGVLDRAENEVFRWLGKGKSQVWVAKKFGVSRKTLYNFLKERECND